MRWTKLKKRVEAGFAPAVAGRIELRDTWYRNSGRSAGRGWLTIDGNEVGSFSDARWWRELYARIHGSKQSWQRAESELRAGGALSRNDFHEALHLFLGCRVEEALESENPIARGLALLDGRFGKRRLRAFSPEASDHPLVHLLYDFRCEAEGIQRAA